MKPASEGKSSKKAVGGDESNIYTALLGLALLVVAATVAIVCFYGQSRFGSIFTSVLNN